MSGEDPFAFAARTESPAKGLLAPWPLPRLAWPAPNAKLVTIPETCFWISYQRRPSSPSCCQSQSDYPLQLLTVRPGRCQPPRPRQRRHTRRCIPTRTPTSTTRLRHLLHRRQQASHVPLERTQLLLHRRLRPATVPAPSAMTRRMAAKLIRCTASGRALALLVILRRQQNVEPPCVQPPREPLPGTSVLPPPAQSPRRARGSSGGSARRDSPPSTPIASCAT